MSVIPVDRLANLSLKDEDRSENAFVRQLTRNGIDTQFLIDNQEIRLHSEQINWILQNAFNSCLPHVECKTMAELRELLESHLSTSPKRSNIEFSNLSITRASLAVLLGKKNLISTLALPKFGCSPNDPDDQGFTACHMAAMLGRYDLLLKLWELGGSMDVSAEGMTVYDVLKARGFVKPLDKKVTVFKDTQVPTKDVLQLIGRKYLSDNIYSPNALLMNWRSRISESRFEDPFFHGIFETYCKIKEGQVAHEPPVCVRKIGPGSPLEGQFELVATRDIRAGEYVMEYTGYVACPGSTDSKYAMGQPHSIDVDAQLGGSFAELANHAAPNCAVTGVEYKGLQRSLMYATKPIKAGTPFFINYGRPYFEAGNGIEFKELNPEAVDEFVQKTKNLTDFSSWALDEDTSQYMPSVHTNNPGAPLQISYYVRDMKEYLYEFPDRLFTLVKTQKLCSGLAIRFFNDCFGSGLTDRLGLDNRYHQKLLAALTA